MWYVCVCVTKIWCYCYIIWIYGYGVDCGPILYQVLLWLLNSPPAYVPFLGDCCEFGKCLFVLPSYWPGCFGVGKGRWKDGTMSFSVASGGCLAGCREAGWPGPLPDKLFNIPCDQYMMYSGNLLKLILSQEVEWGKKSIWENDDAAHWQFLRSLWSHTHSQTSLHVMSERGSGHV